MGGFRRVGAKDSHRHRWSRAAEPLDGVVRSLDQTIRRNDGRLIGASQHDDVIGSVGNLYRFALPRNHQPLRDDRRDGAQSFFVACLRTNRRQAASRTKQLDLHAIA